MKHRFHDEADIEFEDALRYYRRIGRPLAVSFNKQVRDTLGGIGRTPGSYLQIEPGVRRALCRVFPYTIVYLQLAEELFIVAVMHQNREPGYWHHRIPSH